MALCNLEQSLRVALQEQFKTSWIGWLLDLRQDFNQHPERSGEEVRTISRIVTELTMLGYDPKMIEYPTPVGVVRLVIAEVGSDDPETIVGLCADCDAIVSDEVLGHWCGHDIHTTALLGAAQALKGIEQVLKLMKRRVRLFFRGNEETVSERFLIHYPLLQESKCHRFFALHCYPQLKAGKIGLWNGPVNASCDLFEIGFNGRSGHTSRPENAIHAGKMTAYAGLYLEEMVKERFPSGVPLVVEWGELRAGNSINAIPGTGQFKGTARTYDTQVYEQLPKVIREVAENIAASRGGSVNVDYERVLGPLVNDSNLYPIVVAAATFAVENEHDVTDGFQSIGGDGFSYFKELVIKTTNIESGIYYAELGVGGEGDLHSTQFNPTNVRKSLLVGSRWFTTVAVS